MIKIMIRTFSILEAMEETIDLERDLKSMIEKSIKTSDLKTLEDFISAYKADPDKYQINGLINDSDVWDFYIKYKTEIDQILNKDEFYTKSPDDLNVFSLYDYVIEGTKEAVKIKINSFGKTEFTNEKLEDVEYKAYATVRHNLAGRLSNLRGVVATLRSLKFDEETLNLKTSELSTLTFGKCMDILERDILFVSDYVKNILIT